MIREDDPGVDMEGVAGTGFADGGQKGFDVFGLQIQPPVVDVYREEIGASWDMVAAVIGHNGEGSAVVAKVEVLGRRMFGWASSAVRLMSIR